MGLRNTPKRVQEFKDTLQLRGGQFTLRVDAGTPDAIPRKLSSGKHDGETIYELKFPALEGMIMNVSLEDAPKGGKQGKIEIKDFKTGETFDISVFGDSGMFTDFLKYLPNIDTSKEVWLQMNPKRGGKLDVNGNPLTELKVLQDNKVVQNYYSEWDQHKENPKTGKKGMYVSLHGMPEWKHTPKGWNHDDQDYFLWNALEEWNKTFVPPTSDPAIRDVDDEFPDAVEREEEERLPVDDDGSGDDVQF